MNNTADSTKQSIAFPKPLSSALENLNRAFIKENYSAPIPTGFAQLDGLLNGGITPGLTVLGAASSLGKSTFLLQVAEHISSCGTPVLYFSFEMPERYIVAKSLRRKHYLEFERSQPSSINYSASDILSPAKIDELPWDHLDTCTPQLVDPLANLYIIENIHQLSDNPDRWGRPTAGEIVSFARDFSNEKNTRPIIMIDYLQLLESSEDPIKDPRRNVEKTLEQLVELAKEMPVIVISSISRGKYTETMTFEAFKETGMIEFSADVLLGLAFIQSIDENGNKLKINLEIEKSKNPRDVRITVLKNRYGACGEDTHVDFKYYAQADYFIESNSPAAAAPQATAQIASTNTPTAQIATSNTPTAQVAPTTQVVRSANANNSRSKQKKKKDSNKTFHAVP